jgi:hypothetical protein
MEVFSEHAAAEPMEQCKRCVQTLGLPPVTGKSPCSAFITVA